MRLSLSLRCMTVTLALGSTTLTHWRMSATASSALEGCQAKLISEDALYLSKIKEER